MTKVETAVNQERGASRRGCYFEGDQKFHPACTDEGPSTTSISPLTSSTSKDTKLTESDKKKRQREGRSRARIQRQNRQD